DQRTVEQENTARPKVEINVLNLTETTMVLRAGTWTDDAIKGFQMKCDLLLTIKKRFDAEGIEFPFHYRTTVFKN
ncbi:MAG: mechanosensitive ion channel family protein, partial [Bacteroidia bacterium]